MKECPWCLKLVFPNDYQKHGYHTVCFDEHKADYLADLKKDEKFEKD